MFAPEASPVSSYSTIDHGATATARFGALGPAGGGRFANALAQVLENRGNNDKIGTNCQESVV